MKQIIVFQDWDTLFKQISDYINEFIRPHQLISISCFENNHGAVDFIDSDDEFDESLTAFQAVITHYGTPRRVFDNSNVFL